MDSLLLGAGLEALRGPARSRVEGTEATVHRFALNLVLGEDSKYVLRKCPHKFIGLTGRK